MTKAATTVAFESKMMIDGQLVDAPFGCYQASGAGRQNGLAELHQYTEIKSVAYPAT